MKNMTIAAIGENGEQLEIPANTGAQMIAAIMGDDMGVPIRSMYVEAKLSDGKYVRINIPNDHRRECTVSFEGP